MAAQKTNPKANPEKLVLQPTDGSLPAELDFFKYAQSGGKKRKADAANPDSREDKKMKVDESEDEDGSEPDEPTPSATKHRVKTKGSNVPTHLDSFTELRTRYNMPSLVYSNLEKNGYTEPTGIQAYGIPILLEVSRIIPRLNIVSKLYSLETSRQSPLPVQEKRYLICYPSWRLSVHQIPAAMRTQELAFEPSYWRRRESWHTRSTMNASN